MSAEFQRHGVLYCGSIRFWLEAMYGHQAYSPATSEIIFAVQESPEGGYEAKALGYSLFTQADTWAELRKMIRDAVRCHFDEAHRPRVIRLHLTRDEVIAV